MTHSKLFLQFLVHLKTKWVIYKALVKWALSVVSNFFLQWISALPYKTSKAPKELHLTLKMFAVLPQWLTTFIPVNGHKLVWFCRCSLASLKHHSALLLQHLKVFLQQTTVPCAHEVTAKFVSGNRPAVTVGPRKILSLLCCEVCPPGLLHQNLN